MKRSQLAVEKREVFGKKVKKLRKDGILPGNVYGKDIKSTAVQVPLKDFTSTFKEVGETGLVDLKVDGEIKPVLIKNVQVDYVNDSPIHADFYQVNLKEKIKAMVPVVTVGEPLAVADKVGLLLQTLNEIEVEALPEALPENFEVNVERLATVDAQITVGELKTPQGVEILTDPTQVVVKISKLVSKEAEEQATQEAAAQEAAKTEGAEEGAPAEGETPKAEVAAEDETKEKPAEQKEEKPQEAKSQ